MGVEDFKEKLVEFAKTSVSRAGRVMSEEAAKQYLILPFFQFLDYDPLDPDEIIPEADASFSDKFRNKVDYAVCIDGVPVIAVECKKTGSLKNANRGELKGYFNATTSTKLGVLTDGLVYEFYSDTYLDNVMDDEPFLRLDLATVAKERVSDHVLDALQNLRKGAFDPADIGADAKRKIFIARYVEELEKQVVEPTEDFVKVLMDAAEVEGRRTVRLLEEHTPIVQESIRIFLDKKILERVGFANRQDLVRMQQVQPPASPAEEEEGPATEEGEDGIITTDVEIKIFDHVKSRLSFLVNDEGLYRKLDNLFHKDYKTVFAVCYKQERRGKLFNFREGPNGEFRFDFPDREDTIETGDLFSIDEPLFESFQQRVAELG